MKKTFLAAMILAASFTLIPTYGCGDDESDAAATSVTSPDAGRLSRKGEACEVTRDCTPPLACQSFGATGICVVAEFKISATAKECATIECMDFNDCCQNSIPAAQCTFLQTRCEQSDGGPSSIECQQYALYCKCDATVVTCDEGKCKKPCQQDSECAGLPGTTKCGGGKCVRCTADADCGTNAKCVENNCVADCQSDNECPGFSRCEQGNCVTSGCKSDRECVSATRNVEAKCGSDGKCIQPCETDLECGSPKEYSFFSCIDHQCTYTGCDSDKDCLLAAQGLVDAAPPPRVRYVCRDKAH